MVPSLVTCSFCVKVTIIYQGQFKIKLLPKIRKLKKHLNRNLKNQLFSGTLSRKIEKEMS